MLRRRQAVIRSVRPMFDHAPAHKYDPYTNRATGLAEIERRHDRWEANFCECMLAVVSPSSLEERDWQAL